MRIALININRKNKLYPISLLRLGAYLKTQGIYCKLYENRLPIEKEKYDEIWITTVFTWDLPYVLNIIKKAIQMTKRVFTGGILASIYGDLLESAGSEIHIGLFKEAEKIIPDYTLLNREIKYSITHSSRGCIRKCKFCIVPKIEPIFESREWIQDIWPGANHILFYDNNWLAKDIKDIADDCKKIKRFKSEGKIKTIDFNQGLDCRLINKDIVNFLKDMPFNPIRFSYDGLQEEECIEKAIDLVVNKGLRNISIYMLYNFDQRPEYFYHRMKKIINIGNKNKIHKMVIIPMGYEPIIQNTNREFIGKYWTRRQKMAIKRIVSYHSYNGQISMNEKEFFYWFGKNEAEFMKIISYPKIGRLMYIKKEKLRKLRRMN